MKKKSSAMVWRVLSFSIAMAVGTGTVGASELIPKQLAGPPSEFAAMQVPDPVDATIYSHSAVLPVTFTPRKSGAQWEARLPVESDALRFALLLPEGVSVEVSLTGPTGKRLLPADTAKRGKRSGFGMEGAQIPARMYQFEALTPGEWTVSVGTRAKTAAQGYLILEGDRDTELASYTTHAHQWVGETLGVTAQLAYLDAGDKALLGPGAGYIGQATLEVTLPDGKLARYPMFDDGLHGDGAAGDGIYGGQFAAAQAGNHVAQVIVQGVSATGQHFARTVEHLIPVVAPEIQITGERAHAVRAKDADSRLQIQLPVNAPKNAQSVRSYAQVWGHDAAGNAVPVAWIGGMVTPQNGQVSLGLDERWIAKANAQGPFELRQIRLENIDNFVTVAEQSRLPLTMPRLKPRSKAAEVVVDEAMTMGQRPAALVQSKGVGQRLLLVHGYCSGGVWPAAQFGTASSFLDKNQSRSHDAFARLIKSFGDTWNSYGIVAHSQGGAAALHLYTYYWSGLDNASGSRLIQSVGTPYQGTNLAGILAKLGNWFGVGCGTNDNLTYSGSSAWLAGIPTSARAKVNYYTTSFDTAWWRYDYCNMATDLVLDDPEDGTTEKAKGQLPGGVNRGHTTGQCHTTGMRDPAQYLDASRNSTMNANAAR